MSDDDDANYRQRLSEALIRHGFEWVVVQAEAQIAEGKPSPKQISEQEIFHAREDPLFRVRKPRSRRASLITSEPYTEGERLEIFLRAIEAAVVQRAMLEQAIFDELPNISSVNFEPESPTPESEETYFGSAHTLSKDRKNQAHELEKRTRTALEGLRKRPNGSAR